MEVEMVAKGNKDAHRYSYSGGVKAQETEKWGRSVARDRYGSLKYEDDAPPPADKCYPQAPEDKPLDRSYNDVKESSWLRGGNEDGRPPNFDKSKR
jgi:hypothetical protein